MVSLPQPSTPPFTLMFTLQLTQGHELIVGNTLESLKNALSELEGSEAAKIASHGEAEKVKRVDRSNIPRRHMSVNLR